MSEFDPNTTEFDYLIGVKLSGGQRPYGDTNHHIEITFSGKNIAAKAARAEGKYLLVGLKGLTGERGKEWAKEIAQHYRGWKYEKSDPEREWHHTYLESITLKGESETEVTWVAHVVDPYLD